MCKLLVTIGTKTSFDTGTGIFSRVKNKIGTLYCIPDGTGTRTRNTSYFRQFVDSSKNLKKICSQEPEPAPGKKFPVPEPPQNRRVRNPGLTTGHNFVQQ